MSRESKDRKTWIKIFTVSNPQEHPGGFTVYKVVETTFPTSSPDLACTTTAWKRWSQVKTRFKYFINKHLLTDVYLFRPGSSINSESNLNLSISVSQDLSIDATPALVPSPVFSEPSASDSKVYLASEKSSPSSDLSTSTSEQSTQPASNNFIHPTSEESTPSASVASLTFLSALSSPLSECLSTPPIKSSEEPFTVDLASKPLNHTDFDIKQSNPTNPDPFDPLNADFTDPAQLFLNQTNNRVNLDLSTLNLQETGEAELSRPTEAACPGEEAGLTNYEDSNGGIPLYITESAQIIAEALSLEAEEKFDQSIASYRSAIGKLLSSVQADPDATRRAAVKKRVAQYISKAEQLVERELDAKARRPGKKISGIPHLQLFGQLSQLRKYKVVDILDGRLILAQNIDTLEKVVFKVLQKSAGRSTLYILDHVYRTP
ncbi:uncharacterized protein LOC111708647 [Eurytemora carolleeae]|uniref:uncharacterized protein LOC111708647 n=1 Tax=Eurytemora carolleeae TaxID=1294199 RepID=UPI000C7951B1|nr:uncharacterized protein LOC111708647 [Eurytemora carolleeae]|eukprot:XP_023337854.1 uncharacterized protein LOC111708647 [Eurytemora affinis]